MAAANPSEATMLQHALDYLHAELPVFPICSPLMKGHQHRDPQTRQMIVCAGDRVGKTPLVRWRGYQLDLPSEDDVRGWWATWPQANIGMCTGELSGILVLDADGTEARKGCLQRGGLDETPAVWTGKVGGTHFHLAYPEGENLRNFARKLPNTDMRGEGGYVLLPPSLHATGNRYRWAEGTQGIPPSPPPQWLLDLIAGPGEADGVPGSDERLDTDEALRGFPEGQRDDGLFKFACRMRHDDTPQAYAEILIQEAARNCRPAFPLADAIEKVRRAYKEYPPGDAGPEAEFDEEIRPEGARPANDSPPAIFLRPISELLAMPEVDPDWLVDQLFTVGSSGWVAAEPKVGKSWLVLDLVYALATGTPFLSTFHVKQPRRVIYIQEEDSTQRVLRRFKQLLKGDSERQPPSDDYLRWAIRAGFKIDSSEWAVKLAQELEIFPAEVVVLDVFNRVHTRDENKQTDMSYVLEILTKLTQRYGCSFIVVHHNRKPQVGSEARANQLLRGSSVLAGWAECSLYLRKAREQHMFIVVPESKDAPEIEEFSVTLRDLENGGIMLDMGSVSFKDRISKIDEAIMQAIKTIVDDGLDATVQRIAERVGRERSGVSKRLKSLVDSGDVEEDEVQIGRTYVKIYTVTTL